MSTGQSIDGMADLMESYALHLKAQLPIEQQILIDAIILANDVRTHKPLQQQHIDRIRNQAMRYHRESPYISSMMNLIAETIERPAAAAPATTQPS